jgi:hypothetical protein
MTKEDKDKQNQESKPEEKKKTKELIDKSCFTKDELIEDKKKQIKENPIIKK